MAAAKGWGSPRLYTDEGISGTKDASKRPELARLLADAKAGALDAVIILSLDRLGRKTRLVLDLVDELVRYGITLVSCKESLDTSTPQGQFTLTLFAALAQLERDQIAERTSAALTAKGMIDGEKGGRLPFGYLRTEAGLVVDPTAAGIVERIFALRGQGRSLARIAEDLNQTGITSPRGGVWRNTSVREILLNEQAYRGGCRGDSPVRWLAILGAS